jgi:crotonobetaine/carnitine-CoA ligase
MHRYPHLFPVRGPEDGLDIVPLLHGALVAGDVRTLYEFGDDVWAIDRFARRVAGLQGWLRGHGLKPGQRVAVMLDNTPDHIALIAALMLGGIVWVPINTRLKATGLQYVIDHCKPDLAIAASTYAPLWQEALGISSHNFEVTDIPSPAERDADIPLRAEVRPDDVLCIIYTSGTTGAPKGVLFTHRMMRVASEAALRVADVLPGDCLFLWEPLCHIGGAQMLLAPFLADVRLHVVERFSVGRFWDQVRGARATHLHYLGGVLEILMRVPTPEPSSHLLRTVWGAGLTAQTWRKVDEMFGLSIRECYGMTECSSFATVNETGKPGSIGQALPWLRVDLLDGAGHPAQQGEAGEIVLSSEVDGIFLAGYLDNPEATAKTIRNGRLHTGDFARRDADGDLFFVGRGTDSMRVRGENVSAWEIERVLALHPAIQACAAIGVDSEIGEQDILLYVQVREGAQLDWDELLQWSRNHLPSYQVPRYYLRVQAFEVTPSERIRKSLLPRSVEGAWDAAPARV